MIIRFDLFTEHSGKWKYGGEVEIGDVQLWQDNFVPTILRNQREVVKGCITSGNYFMVTDNLPGDKLMSLPFVNHLFLPKELKKFWNHDHPLLPLD